MWVLLTAAWPWIRPRAQRMKAGEGPQPISDRYRSRYRSAMRSTEKRSDTAARQAARSISPRSRSRRRRGWPDSRVAARSLKVAYAVAVRVLKGARVDLIDHARLPPERGHANRALGMWVMRQARSASPLATM